MHDTHSIRERPDEFDHGLARRRLAPMAAEILALDIGRRDLQTRLQDVQRRRNEASKEIGVAKGRGEDASALIAEVASLKGEMQNLEADERDAAARLDEILGGLPNLAADDVPDGETESDNREIRVVGDRPDFEFAPKTHEAIGAGLAMMDFERAAKMSGARFVVLSGALARLERALADFMLDLHTEEFGYTEVSPPLLVRDAALYGTGQLPKFAEDLFATADGYWLVPTGEVPLANLVAGEILDAGDLPRRMTAHTACFRSEAGAAGKDSTGMIRQHQFQKVELVSITRPDQSEAELERMTGAAEEVLKRLGLHYRVVMLCAGDMGFSARKTYDIEVWLPGQERFREISSCSDCGAFQARRMNARFRPEGEKGNRFVHTLNGSGLAVGRTLIAVLENYQRADGSVAVPAVLRPYLRGLEQIAAPGGTGDV